VQQILRTGIAAAALMLCSACAITTTKVGPLSAPTPAGVLTPLQSTPLQIPISEELQPPPPRHPAEDAAAALPSVAAEELIVAPATSEPPPPAAPAYYQSFASYYAKRFEGRRTASGEPYDPAQLTAATRDFPLQSWLKVINPANGREVIVRVNDRTGKRKTPLVDLSRAAASKLGFLGKGKIRVHVIPISPAP